MQTAPPNKNKQTNKQINTKWRTKQTNKQTPTNKQTNPNTQTKTPDKQTMREFEQNNQQKTWAYILQSIQSEIDTVTQSHHFIPVSTGNVPFSSIASIVLALLLTTSH